MACIMIVELLKAQKLHFDKINQPEQTLMIETWLCQEKMCRNLGIWEQSEQIIIPRLL